jgi:ATP-binding cassette, subfamily B, bacterial MsbA
LLARFNSDMQIMSDAVGIALPQLVIALFTFAFSFAYMIYINWLLTLTLVVLAPLISIAVSRFQKLISTSMTRSQSRIADLTATLSEVLQAQRVVKAFGREAYENDRFKTRNEDYYGAFMKLTQFVQLQPAVITAIFSPAVVAIIWLSVQQVLVHRLDSGSLLTYWLLVVNPVNPMNRVAQFVGDLNKGTVSAGRTYEIIDLPVEEEVAAKTLPMPPIEGEIAFESVTFWYKRDEAPALDGVDATIHAGEIVALVGPSGAGKTTFVNMIPRFYQAQNGCVRIDGIDLATASIADLRKQIAIVPQDPQLFRASIAENIRYGRLEATDDEVRGAAIEANAEEFIAGLPEGYATQVGERGARLSGGQRQRIAIARAIVRDPRILILDEATSALDSHSEALIEQALDRLLPGRTTLIIAHRLSTIRRANRILYIEGGRLLEFGTHDELMSKNGAYAKLHAAQFAL